MINGVSKSSDCKNCIHKHVCETYKNISKVVSEQETSLSINNCTNFDADNYNFDRYRNFMLAGLYLHNSMKEKPTINFKDIYNNNEDITNKIISIKNINEAAKQINRYNMIGIYATTTDDVIGINGTENHMPCHSTEDLQFFKKVTTNHIIIMGSKTFESLGKKPLPNRINIVMSTHYHTSNYENLIYVHNKEELYDMLDIIYAVFNNISRDIYVIGGSKIFEVFNDDIIANIVTVIDINIDDALSNIIFTKVIVNKSYQHNTTYDITPIDSEKGIGFEINQEIKYIFKPEYCDKTYVAKRYVYLKV